jgi:hypothetical protein
MRQTNSCIVETSASILSTLDPTKCDGLEEITLNTTFVSHFLDKAARAERVQDWKNLDTTLSKHATASINITGRRLMFSFVPSEVHGEKCLVFAREWLPKLLPRFHELGSLRVHRGGIHHEVSYTCRCHGISDSGVEDSGGGLRS